MRLLSRAPFAEPWLSCMDRYVAREVRRSWSGTSFSFDRVFVGHRSGPSPPLHTKNLADLALDASLSLTVLHKQSLLAGDIQTQDLILQDIGAARLSHVYVDHTPAFGPFDIEMHSEVLGAKPVDLAVVCEGSGARPLVGGRLAVSLDLGGWAEKGSGFWTGLDAANRMVELDGDAVGRKKLRVQEVEDGELQIETQVRWL